MSRMTFHRYGRKLVFNTAFDIRLYLFARWMDTTRYLLIFRILERKKIRHVWMLNSRPLAINEAVNTMTDLENVDELLQEKPIESSFLKALHFGPIASATSGTEKRRFLSCLYVTKDTEYTSYGNIHEYEEDPLQVQRNKVSSVASFRPLTYVVYASEDLKILRCGNKSECNNVELQKFKNFSEETYPIWLTSNI
ncbi:unnamed protein product [Xylocopa violacea]|uniref:Uncharacterized protein n=1 Tax=Xylocopa violacea TaxID=135666 RepID=A0ABP1PE22_XYLVO